MQGPTYFAVVDPNWGNPIPLLSTLSESPEEAIRKAVSTHERGASIYSGATNICVPPIAGDWGRMLGFGYRVRAAQIVLGATL